METGRVFKIVAGAFGGVYFWANCLFAYSPETNFWAERRNRTAGGRSSGSTVAVLPGEVRGASFPQMAGKIPRIGASLLGDQISDPVKEGLPAGFLEKNEVLFSILARAPGTVRKISLPPHFTSSSPIVVYIQDVHRNEEAQRNIGSTVAGLMTEGNAGLLALEGAYGPIPLQPFRDFQNRQAVQQAADYLLKENRISGPIHAVLTGTGPLCPVIGIDDPVHYAANVEAYRQAVLSQNEIQNSLRARTLILEQEKKTVFSAPLLEFDGKVADYRDRRLSLGDYTQVLLYLSEEKRLSPTLRHFSEAVAMERAMDFSQVEQERTALVEQLARKISLSQEKDLLAVTLAYRAGQVRPAVFYGRLNRLCVKNGISLAAFPAMDEYLHYVLLADKINLESLYLDILSLERETYQRLARTSDEQRLLAKSRKLYLTEKLVGFSLTPPEWEEYRVGLSEGMAEGETLKPFESFYREAKIRDRAMGTHFLHAMSETAGRTAVLVTGGFHAEGLTENLTKGGAAVVSFVPKIEKLDGSEKATYLSVFTQEKTPLEKLYLREKLFLAYHPASPRVLHMLLPLLVAIGAIYLGGLSLNLDPQVIYSSLGGMGVLGAVKIMGDQIRFRLSGRNGETSLMIKMTSAGIDKVIEGSSSNLGIWGKKVRGVRDRWVFTKNILNERFTSDDRVNTAQIRKELLYVLPILGVLLYNACISPVAPWVYFVTGGGSLGWFLWDHQQMFRQLQQSTPERYKKYVPYVYFPFVALGFVLFTGFGVGAFSIVVALTQTGAGTASAAGLAAAAVAFLSGVLTSHFFFNSRLAVPSVAKKKNLLPSEAFARRQLIEQDLRGIYKALIESIKLAVEISGSEAVRTGSPSSEEVDLASELFTSFNTLREMAMEMDDRVRDILDFDGPIITSDEEGDWAIEQEKMNRMIDAIWRNIFIPAGRCPFDSSIAEGLLVIQKGSWIPVTYLGETVWIAQVKPEKGKPSRVLSPAMGGINGFIFYDPAPVEDHQNVVLAKYPPLVKKYFQDKKREGIGSWALNYGITDLIVRHQLAASKSAIFTALKNNVSVSGVSREQIQDAVVRPEGSLMKWGNIRNQKRKEAREILPEFTTTASVLAFAATLDGLIENLQHVAFHFGEKKGPDIAHLVGVFGLMEICMTASMVQSNSNHHLISAGVLQDQIVKRVYYPRNVYSAAYAQTPNPKEIIFHALTTGDLNTYEKLLALLEQIRDETLYTPTERFYALKGRGPRSSELRDLTTAHPIVLTGGITGNTQTTHTPAAKKRTPTMAEIVRKYSKKYVFDDPEFTSFITRFSEISRSSSNVGEGEELNKFNELWVELNGGESGHGFRALAGTIQSHKNEASICLALVEDLLKDLADKAFRGDLELAQNMIRGQNFKAAILVYLKLEKEFELLEVLGGPMRSELDGHLRTARALLVRQQTDSERNLGWVVANRELFGFDDQEVRFLKTIQEDNATAPPFDLLGLKSLQNRLGNYAPKGLTAMIEERSQQVDEKPEDDGNENSIGGFRIFINPHGIDSNYWRNERADILTKLQSYIEKGVAHQQAKGLPSFDAGFSNEYLGRAAPNILYDRTSSGRFFFMVFDEPMGEEGKRRKTIAIVGVDSASSIKVNASGKISADTLATLKSVGLANSFGNLDVFGNYRPVELRKGKKATKDNPASLADQLANHRWGVNSWEYYRYTKYVAPAWELIYFVPGLNLLGQWGLSDWIIHKLFPHFSEKVVRQVPFQTLVTGLGVFALGVGIWFGGGVLLVGAVLCASSLAYVFGGAHPIARQEDRLSLIQTGFWLALVLMAPILFLYWWDPVWLTGMGAIMGYGGAFGLGAIGNYFLHGSLQPLGKPPTRNRAKKGESEDTVRRAVVVAEVDSSGNKLPEQDARAAQTGPRVLELAMAAERYLVLGDTGRAKELIRLAMPFLVGKKVPLLQSYLTGLNQRISEIEEYPEMERRKDVGYLLGLVEEGFERMNFGPLLEACEKIEQNNYFITDEQRVLLAIWNRILIVLKGALDPNKAFSDELAKKLGETGRALISRGGILIPYHENILFRFLWSYWARRNAKIFYPFLLAEYEPLLERILRKYPSLSMDINELSNMVGNYVEEHDRKIISSFLVQKGMPADEASLFLLEIDLYTNPEPIDTAEGLNRNRGGDPLESSGMHAVGGETSEENRRIFQHIAGSKATVEVRRQWGNEIRGRLERHRERRRAIQKLNLGNSIDQLLTLLEMENPTVKIGDRDIPVNFQLLPESWKQSSPGSQRADWYFRVRDNHEIESVEIILDRDDLGAVVHEGVEVVLSCLPYDKRPKGKPHTYAFLAEVLANDNGDDLVPQRALDEIDHKSLEELVDFLKGSAASLDEIENLFGDSSLFFAKKRLLDIHEKLERRASVMRDEREKDPLWLFNLQVAKAEKSIAVGALVQGQQDLKDLDRILYHLERTKGHHPLQSSLVAELQKRLNKIIEISEKIKEREQIHAWDFSDHLKKMEEQFRFRDFLRLLTSFGRVKTWTSGPLYPEQLMLADFWIDIENILRPLIRGNDWNASDQKVQEFENRWLGELGRLGAGHMYLEGLLYEFLEAYRAQKKRGKDWSHYLAHENDDNTHGTPILVDFLDNYPNANTTLRVLSDTALAVKAFMESKFASWQNNKGTSGINKQKGIALPEMALFLPGIVASVSLVGWVLVKGLTDPGLMFPSLLAATAGGLIVVGVIGVVVIYVSVRFGDFLERKKSAALGFASVLKKAEEEGDLAHGLRLDVAGQDLVRKASAEEGVWFRRYLKKAMAKLGVAPLSFAAARALISVKGWRAQVFEASAGVMPDAGGSRSLVIIYLNNDMVSGGVADVTERYSPGGEGILVFVPTDRGSRAAVSDMPDTFGGLIFDGGPGRADRMPSLAVVERRLAIAGVNFAQYTGCRVVTPVGMALDAEGVQSDLFKEALVILLNGMMGLVIKRKNLHSIDRAARAIVSAA